MINSSSGLTITGNNECGSAISNILMWEWIDF